MQWQLLLGHCYKNSKRIQGGHNSLYFVIHSVHQRLFTHLSGFRYLKVCMRLTEAITACSKSQITIICNDDAQVLLPKDTFLVCYWWRQVQLFSKKSGVIVMEIYLMLGINKISNHLVGIQEKGKLVVIWPHKMEINYYKSFTIQRNTFYHIINVSIKF